MPDYIRPGTCGACKEFEFEGNNKKGYCRRYGAYYWDDDSCRHYEEDEYRLSGSKSSTCFLTSACCRYKGLPDDCYELTTLRQFRDTYLAATEEGKVLVEEYYKIAPSVVEKIIESVNRDEILSFVYGEICRILGMIEKEEDESAVKAYKEMVLQIQERL